jgi:protein-disulfide isomerase
MKIQISAAALAFALLLSGCGDEGGDLNAAAANQAAPLQQIPAPNNGSWAEVVTRTDEGFRIGNPDAPVKLVEYASLTCPHCAAFSAEATQPLRETYIRSGQVSWEYRPFILNAQDAAASIAARCLAPEGFFPAIEQLFAQQREWTAAIDEAESQSIAAMPQNQQLAAAARAMDLDTFFARRGMPDSQFNQCLSDQQAAQQLAEMNQRAAEEHQIRGTPTFLINGETQQVSDWSALEPLLRGAIGG